MSTFLRNPPWTSPAHLFHGRKVYLRPPQLTDWSEWARLRTESREHLTPWEPTWSADELTRNAYRRRLRRYHRDARDGYGYTFFLFERINDTLVGGITLSNIRRGVTQSCAVGYWMGMPHAGKGFMSDGLTALLPFVFKELALHRLEAACLPHNEPSKSVLRRVGFQEEGYARQYLKINGKWQDHLLFALLASDVDLK